MIAAVTLFNGPAIVQMPVSVPVDRARIGLRLRLPITVDRCEPTDVEVEGIGTAKMPRRIVLRAGDTLDLAILAGQ